MFLLLPTVGESYEAAVVDSKAGEPKVVEVEPLKPPKGILVPRAASDGEATVVLVAPKSVPPLTKPDVEEAGLAAKPPPPNGEERALLVLVVLEPPNSPAPGLLAPLSGDDILVEPTAPNGVEPNRPPPPGLAEKLPKVPAGLPEGFRPRVGGPVVPESSADYWSVT